MARASSGDRPDQSTALPSWVPRYTLSPFTHSMRDSLGALLPPVETPVGSASQMSASRMAFLALLASSGPVGAPGRANVAASRVQLM